MEKWGLAVRSVDIFAEVELDLGRGTERLVVIVHQDAPLFHQRELDLVERSRALALLLHEVLQRLLLASQARGALLGRGLRRQRHTDAG